MDLQKLTRKLRLVLYKNMDCKTVIMEFKRVLREYEYEVVINISDENEALIVDIEPLIQFIRVKKKNPVRVYQVIPKTSPLKPTEGRPRNDKRKRYFKREGTRAARLALQV